MYAIISFSILTHGKRRDFRNSESFFMTIPASFHKTDPRIGTEVKLARPIICTPKYNKEKSPYAVFDLHSN